MKYADILCLQAKVEYKNCNVNHQKLSTLGSSGIYLAYSGGVGVPSVVVRIIFSVQWLAFGLRIVVRFIVNGPCALLGDNLILLFRTAILYTPAEYE